MNMKSILTCLTVLTLSFNVLALEVQEKPKTATPLVMSSVIQKALNQEHSPAGYLAAPVNNPKTAEASAEKPSEFLTALSVYLIIIIIYSIYGFKANSKNIRN